MRRSALYALTIGMLMLSGVVTKSAHAEELFYLTPKINGCSGDGLREYAAIIDGRNYWGDWVVACRNTPLQVNGVDYPSRDCGWNGGRVWGKFDVADSSCAVNLRFEAPKRDHCVSNGLRQWSAIISGDNYTGDWVEACRNTQASIEGASYSSHDCGWNGGRVWGLFDVPDDSCLTRLYFEVAQRGECLPNGTREYAAIISGNNYVGDWVQACQLTRANIGDQSYVAQNCAWNGSRVWGTFEVPDSSCHMRVRGRIRYQDYEASGSNGSFAQSGVRDVRRSRVEIWYGTSPARAARVAETRDDGTFDTFVPVDDLGSYRAVVVATNPAGQVNLRDNTATWYWTPETTLATHPDGDGLIVGPVSGLVFSDPYGDAMSFNALDALLVARDYAIQHGVPVSRLNLVSIVPTTSDLTPRTTASGAWSLIWLPDQTDARNYMFDDGAILHEYAHHIQRMNDTYALWPAIHDGCWANVAGSEVNSDEFAWFEGFPEYFRIAVGAWDNSKHLNSIRSWPTYYPVSISNPTRRRNPCDAAATYGSGAVEDYVASLLLDLTRSNNVTLTAGALAASRDELERHLLTLFFNEMYTIRPPGNGMPRIGDFRLLWNHAFPDSSFLDDLMIAYGMQQSMYPEPVTGTF